MKLQYRDIINRNNAISEFMAVKPSPLIDVSHRLVINTRRINEKLNDFTKARDIIHDGYLEDGKMSKENEELFKADFEELLDQEFEIEIRVITDEMIKESEKARKGFSVPQNAIWMLSFMFEEDVEGTK